MDRRPPQKDDILDGYRLIRPLGTGGFGEVWLCRSDAVGDFHALKLIESTNPNLVAREFEALGLYRKTVARIGSPHLFPIEHARPTEKGFYYIMPLADGLNPGDPADPSWRPRTLEQCIQQKAAGTCWFTAEEVVEIFVPILGGLQDLSDAGLVHRDVKPDNILFLNGRPCLCDISLLRTDAREISRIGTQGYAPPDWYQGGHLDMYGAASTFYNLITGYPPDCIGRSAFHWPKRDELIIAEADRPRWKAFHRIIRRARDEKPSERFPDFSAMARALLDTLNPGLPAQIAPPPIPAVSVPANDAPHRVPPSLPPISPIPPVSGDERRTRSRFRGRLTASLGLLTAGLLGYQLINRDSEDYKESHRIGNPQHAGTNIATESGKAVSGPAPASANTVLFPEIDRSPRDSRKGNTVTEDARLAYNSMAWFMQQDGLLTPGERDAFGEVLARIETIISDPEAPDLEAAARFLESARETIPAIRRSQNARLAGMLFLYLEGDHDTARQAEADPDLKVLGDDELAYRVELMARLKMDPEPLLERIIASPATKTPEVIPALMERARLRGAEGDHDGARQDVTSALKLSNSDAGLTAWVLRELEALKRTDDRLDRALEGLPEEK